MLLHSFRRWYFFPPFTGTQTSSPTVSDWLGTVTPPAGAVEVVVEGFVVVLGVVDGLGAAEVTVGFEEGVGFELFAGFEVLVSFELLSSLEVTAGSEDEAGRLDDETAELTAGSDDVSAEDDAAGSPSPSIAELIAPIPSKTATTMTQNHQSL